MDPWLEEVQAGARYVKTTFLRWQKPADISCGAEVKKMNHLEVLLLHHVGFLL